MIISKRELIIHAINRDGNRCYLCQKAFSRNNPPTLDHIWPISRGGQTIPDNSAAAHKDCNVDKGDRIFLPDGTLEPKPKKRQKKQKGDKVRWIERVCMKCLGGRLLSKGQTCISCCARPGPASGRMYLKTDPSWCARDGHFSNWCKVCSSGLVERDIPIRNLV